VLAHAAHSFVLSLVLLVTFGCFGLAAALCCTGYPLILSHRISLNLTVGVGSGGIGCTARDIPLAKAIGCMAWVHDIRLRGAGVQELAVLVFVGCQATAVCCSGMSSC
jgi:hypothetical protein